FFQAEDGIRDRNVTGVQTCALPICLLSKFVLEDVLAKQLRKLNQIEYKGDVYNFADNTFGRASRELQQVLEEGLVSTNESIYDLLTLGKSFEQIIKGDKKSFPFKYIDWENPEKN